MYDEHLLCAKHHPSFKDTAFISRQKNNQRNVHQQKNRLGTASEQDDVIGPTGIGEGFSLVTSKLRSEE